MNPSNETKSATAAESERQIR